MSLKLVKRASTLNELAVACRSAARSIEKDVNAIAQEAANKIIFRLIYETPVDTSQALSNWQVSFEIPTSARIRAYKEGEQGSTKEYSAGRAYSKAKQLISRKKPRVDLIITNNLTYIHKLNMGGSKQQPSAFYVERIVSSIEAEVKIKIQRYVNGY